MAVRLLASLPPLTRRWIGLDWIFFLFGWGFDSGDFGGVVCIAVEPGEHGRGAGHGWGQSARAPRAHQRPRQVPRLHARCVTCPLIAI